MAATNSLRMYRLIDTDNFLQLESPAVKSENTYASESRWKRVWSAFMQWCRSLSYRSWAFLILFLIATGVTAGFAPFVGGDNPDINFLIVIISAICMLCTFFVFILSRISDSTPA